jgi:hypothetical protein
MGECPLEYRLIRAARYLGVAPWDLAKRPTYWQEWALICEKADILALLPRGGSPKND